MAGASVTINTMLGCDKKIKVEHSVTFMTAGAAPPPAMIKRFENEIAMNVRTVRC